MAEKLNDGTEQITPVSRTREAAAVRRHQALQLRIGAASYRQIAQVLRISVGQAFSDVSRALEEAERQALRASQQARTLQLERLNTLLAAVFPRADRGDLLAALRALQIVREQNKVLGLYAPQMINLDPVEETKKILAELQAEDRELDFETALAEVQHVLHAYGPGQPRRRSEEEW